MTNTPNTLTSLLMGVMLATLLSACASRLPVRQQAEELAGAVEQLRNPDFMQRRHRATAAKQTLIDKVAPWLTNEFIAHYEKVPATHAIRAVLDGYVTVFNLSDAHSNPMVSAPTAASTIGEHLDAIASQTNWNYQIEKNVVYWSDLPTRVFKIAFPQGQWSAQLGRGSDGEGAKGTQDGQYVRSQHNINFWEELGDGLQAVLGEYSFTVLPSVNSVSVTAPPDYLRRVAKLVERFNRSASQRVLVELEIYLVDLSDSEQETLDWSFVRNKSGKVLNLAQGAGSLLEGLAPFTLSLNDLSDGKHSGSHFIFNALAAQGATTLVSRPKLICLNNQVSELRLTRVIPYTAELSFTTEDNSAVSRRTPNVDTEEVVTGTTIYVLPTINGQRVNLNLSINYTQINRFLTQSFGDTGNSVDISLPEYDDTQFTLPVALNSGETMVLAGNPRTISGSEHRTHRWSLLGHDRRKTRRRTETVMLLTVHVLDPA